MQFYGLVGQTHDNYMPNILTYICHFLYVQVPETDQTEVDVQDPQPRLNGQQSRGATHSKPINADTGGNLGPLED